MAGDSRSAWKSWGRYWVIGIVTVGIATPPKMIFRDEPIISMIISAVLFMLGAGLCELIDQRWPNGKDNDEIQ